MGSVIVDKKIVAVWLFVLLAAMTCSTKTNNLKMDPAEFFQRGEEAFNKKRYEKAIDNFNMVILNSPGGELADDAQYYLGECYFKKKEYLLAVSEYQQLTERYSYSPLAEKAYYQVALSYFEQSPKYPLEQQSSLRALQAFQDFIDSYPASELRLLAERKIVEIRNKLARKVFESGQLYRKLEQFESSILYLDKMLEEFYDTDWAVFAHLEKAHCYIRLRQFDQYQETLKLVRKYDSSDEINAYLHRLNRVYEKEQRKIAHEEKRNQRR
ncbi:outer membrane protein assembly factor BamD [bacterium]|nr:outer membrane protein assembly factor BamD [bacterium]MBU1065071.1 outer membrane protein assembly factor BamD [bacterium]MBU1874676.1 outer membrane protein assembly factor BamD [bacterium]